jgi:hypothetical protein
VQAEQFGFTGRCPTNCQRIDLLKKWKNRKIILLPVVNGNDLILKQYNGTV